MLLTTVGCAGTPQYAPPTDREAKAAVVRAIRADLIDTPPAKTFSGPTAIGPDDTPASGMRKVKGAFEQQAELEDRAEALSTIASLESMRVSNCRWGRMRGADILAYGAGRVDAVGRGYRCRYEETHDVEHIGLVRAEGEGFFFKRDDTYDFATIKQGKFDRVGDFKSPQ